MKSSIRRMETNQVISERIDEFFFDRQTCGNVLPQRLGLITSIRVISQ